MRLALTATLSLPLLLTGCALTNTATPTTSAGALLKGNVHGGQQPVTGAHVYLFAANTTGYGQPSVSLLNANTDGTDSLGSYVLTDTNGGFSITGDYHCTASSQVYLLATGGNPGLPNNQTNPNLALMTNLGQCPASGSFAANIPTVAINEVTTIASVYAISGFMTDLTHVSSSGTPLAQTGIANAFATTNNLVDITTGNALAVTRAGNGVVPQLAINTIADIIATCVNSTGASSTTCTTLFSTALNGSTQPTDTVTAALNMVHNPVVGVTTLYALIPAAPPFPALPAFLRNHDFSLTLQFSGGGIQPTQHSDTVPYNDHIAIDANGNVWKTNSLTGSLTELNNLGVPLSSSTGYLPSNTTVGQNIAVDPFGKIWVSQGNYTLEQLDASTGSATGVTVSVPGNLDLFSIDGYGNIWALQSAGIQQPGGGYLAAAGITKIDHSTYSTTAISGGGLDSGFNGIGNIVWGIAVSGNNDVWVLNGNTSLSEFDGPTGTAISPANGDSSGLPDPNGMIINGNGNLWVPDANQFSIENLDSNGNILLNDAPSTGGPLNMGPPIEMALDGANTIWVVNGDNSILVRLDSTSGAAIPTRASYYQGDTSTFYLGTTHRENPASIAVDSSGNIWATDTTIGSYEIGFIIEYVGLATPTSTPISAAIATHTLGARP